MTLVDWAIDPASKMPCLYTEMNKLVQADPISPMNEQPITPMSLKLADNQEQEFKTLVALMKETQEEEKNEEEDDEDPLKWDS